MPTMPDQLDVKALLELCEKATPGPWEFRDGHSREGDSIEILMAEIGHAAEDEDPEYGYVFGSDFPEVQVSANWELTQAARTALPLALAKIAELQAQHHEDKRYLDDIAQALHPHKPAFSEERWTYLPDQLPGMVRALTEQVAALRADKERYEHILKMHPYYTRHNIDVAIECERKADAARTASKDQGGGDED